MSLELIYRINSARNAVMLVRCLLLVAALSQAAFSMYETKPPYDRTGYYGKLSQGGADRAAFAPLLRRYFDRPYSEVRRKLIAQGFRPVRMHHDGVDGADRCMIRKPSDPPELFVCQGRDFAGKSFVFRRPHGRGYAIVTTYGEREAWVNTIRAATKSDLEDIRQYYQGRD